jgi:hypothetical protein
MYLETTNIISNNN